MPQPLYCARCGKPLAIWDRPELPEEYWAYHFHCWRLETATARQGTSEPPCHGHDPDRDGLPSTEDP